MDICLANTPRLYIAAESGNSRKALLLASLLQIELDVVELVVEDKPPELTRINSKGTVPTLVDGDVTLTDSAAILVYLAGKYPDRVTGKAPSSYWSADVAEQAAITDWLAFASSWMQYGVAVARSMVSFGGGAYYGLSNTGNEQTLREAQTRAKGALDILEENLGNREWLVLGRPMVADVAVFVYAALAPMGDISLEPYPGVGRWMERMKSLPGFLSMKGF